LSEAAIIVRMIAASSFHRWNRRLISDTSSVVIRATAFLSVGSTRLFFTRHVRAAHVTDERMCRVLVLGVDPGLTRCGIGVVEGDASRRVRMVDVGVIRTPADAALGPRLVDLERELGVWLDRHRPDAVAVERVFSQHNVRTVMGTAQASAVAVLSAARLGIEVTLHTPSEVKAAITGSGRADKAQVTAMVTRVLRLSEPPRPADAADALALAICHVWRGAAVGRLAEAMAAARQGGHPRLPARVTGRRLGYESVRRGRDLRDLTARQSVSSEEIEPDSTGDDGRESA
jgi:crossover junction endodeoxyribonuclease RuvC